MTIPIPDEAPGPRVVRITGTGTSPTTPAEPTHPTHPTGSTGSTGASGPGPAPHGGGPGSGSPVLRARLRVLPWRLRRRVRGRDGVDGSGLLDGADDLLGVALALGIVLVLAFPLLLGLALLPLELALLAVVVAGLLLARLLGLAPWTVAVEERAGSRWVPVGRVQVRGTRAARQRRDELDALVRPRAAGQARAAVDPRHGVQWT